MNPKALDYMMSIRINNLNEAYHCLQEHPRLVEDLEYGDIVDVYTALMKNEIMFRNKRWEISTVQRHKEDLSNYLKRFTPEKANEIKKSYRDLIQSL